MFLPLFALDKGRYRYTRRLILQPISAACPRIDIYTNPQPPPYL